VHPGATARYFAIITAANAISMFANHVPSATRNYLSPHLYVVSVFLTPRKHPIWWQAFQILQHKLHREPTMKDYRLDVFCQPTQLSKAITVSIQRNGSAQCQR